MSIGGKPVDDGLSVVLVTIVARHRCGRYVTLHGDDWDDVHGMCVHCDEEYHLSFVPGGVEVTEE